MFVFTSLTLIKVFINIFCMKFSIAISTKGVKFSPIAIKGAFESSLKKVAGFGYSAVEIAVKNPDEINISRFKNLLKKYRLSVSSIGTGLVYFEDKLSLSDRDRKIRQDAIKRIRKHILLANELNCFVVIGLVRGKHNENNPKENALKLLKESVYESANFADENNVKLLIEPINRYEVNLINNADESIQFIKEIKMSNLGILLDTFHMNIEECDICKSIITAKNYLWHIHLADSNRYAPGLGHIDFKKILKTLNEIEYKGYYSFEILPYPSPDSSVKLAIEYIKKIQNQKPTTKIYKNPSLTVDIIIENDDKSIILIKRKNHPFKSKWALPGGFVEYGERVEDAVLREAEEETGLKVKLKKVLGVYSDPNRDPRGHTVSVVYIAEPVGGKLKAGTDTKEVKKFKKFNKRTLAFDHYKIIKDYLHCK